MPTIDNESEFLIEQPDSDTALLNLKNGEEAYTLLRPEIEKIHLDKLYKPYMPIAHYILEALAYSGVAENNIDSLLELGFPATLIKTNRLRASACTYANSIMTIGTSNPERSRKTLRTKVPIAIKLRSRLIALFKLIAHDQPDMLHILKTLKKGKGAAEVIEDLRALYKLKENVNTLNHESHIDLSLFDCAQTTANELTELRSNTQTEKLEYAHLRTVLSQSITLLKQSKDEILSWADFVFSDNPEIRRQFNSNYCRKQYLKKLRKKEAGPEPIPTIPIPHTN